MDLQTLSSMELPPTVNNLHVSFYSLIAANITKQQADFHVHLRQDQMMHLVTPLVQRGGCDIVYVMPNLTPPIRSVTEAVQYHKELTQLAPEVTFLMSLFLHSGLNEEMIAEAKKSGVVYGVRLFLSIFKELRERVGSILMG
jgi:dihydroorotase